MNCRSAFVLQRHSNTLASISNSKYLTLDCDRPLVIYYLSSMDLGFFPLLLEFPKWSFKWSTENSRELFQHSSLPVLSSCGKRLLKYYLHGVLAASNLHSDHERVRLKFILNWKCNTFPWKFWCQDCSRSAQSGIFSHSVSKKVGNLQHTDFKVSKGMRTYDWKKCMCFNLE